MCDVQIFYSFNFFQRIYLSTVKIKFCFNLSLYLFICYSLCVIFFTCQYFCVSHEFQHFFIKLLINWLIRMIGLNVLWMDDFCVIRKKLNLILLH